MANVLLVSFMIAWENDDTYNKIYQDLNDALTSSPGTRYWCETTSFCAVETTENTAQLVARLVRAARLRPAKDKLLVLDANVKSGSFWGNIQNGDLYRLLPFVKKL